MATIKKLVFAPLFLVIFSLLTYQLSSVFKSYDFIFSLSLASLIQLIVVSSLIVLSSILFIIFASLASDWKIVLPIGLLACLLSIIFLNQATAVVLAVGIFVSLLLSYLSLENSLKTYLTFNPNSLLGPSIRHLSSLLILIIALSYFLAINKIITQNGFQIPDSLIDGALKFTPIQPESSKPQVEDSPSQLSIPQEQLEMLNKNPELLKQSGLDPKILDSLNRPTKNTLNTPKQLTNDLIKQALKSQLQSFLKPYQSFIPVVLALLLFLTLQSLTSIVNLLVYPLLWIIFFILEKSGFVKFEEEQRTVKKLIV